MEAAALGTWVCGRASEIAMKHQSEESLVPSDTAAQLGSAIEDWRISRR
jgi:NAD(P)H-hydrate repair Nnr-like enzyme with NAD(P)H-hydrate dehydratase domain